LNSNTDQSFKAQMIQEAEKAVNYQRKQREILQEELELIDAKEQEARAVLQLLKTGSAPSMRNGKRLVSKEEFLEAIQAAGVDGQVFKPGDLAELLGMNSGHVAGRLKKMAGNDDTVVMVEAGGPGVPSKYKLKG
jgi:hypothetical protein